MVPWWLSEGYREARYHFAYAKVSYRQKYYSSSKNPRVIQAKMGNTTLLSLRTCPRDQYLVKPGEFLALERKDKVYVEEESSTENKVIDPFLGFSRSPSMQCVCASQIEQEGSGSTDSSKPSFMDRMRSLTGRDSGGLIETPVTSNVNTPIQTTNKSIQKYIPPPPPPPPPLSESSNEPQPPPLPPRPTTEKPSRYKSLIGRLHQPSSSRSVSLSSKSRVSSGGEVWKNVLNDVSLSAARVSIGHSPKTSIHFKVLSGDFIEAEMYPQKETVRGSSKQTNLEGGHGYDFILELESQTDSRPQTVDSSNFLSLYELTRRETIP
ncbi:hypothetical protein CAAN1_05S05622 [[Candida] anglica]|uniref:SH3 domain-containing protein n=1 Tax=[Candida] anglica TaxID=148631 RepID=A0ABP0EHQ5_9ASCO